MPGRSDPERLRRNVLMPLIPGFETAAQAETRNRAMVKLLSRAPELEAAASDLLRCSHSFCAAIECTEACHHATRRYRLKAIPSAAEALRAIGPPYVDLSIVHPSWECEPGKLHDAPIEAARQWLYRRFATCSSDVCGIGSFEVSLNVELDGGITWAGEAHLIVAGVQAASLREAFAIPQSVRRRQKHGRLLVVEDRHEPIDRSVGYALKRFVEQRIAYTNPKNGRKDRRHLPLPRRAQLEHDGWLLSLPVGARTLAFGCSRRGPTFITRA
jgi:hypothetical protein